MPEDDERRGEVIRRMFYLLTVAAEDAATLAAEGQSHKLQGCRQVELACHLRQQGETIDIVASAIEVIARPEFRQ